MTRRKVSNPLALAIMACLVERPMHPYEMASTMRERGKDLSIKLNYGSLYNVIRSLERNSLISVKETGRAGSRPERTVYELTEEGWLEFVDWLSQLLRDPAMEYPQYVAGLSLIVGVAPEEAVSLLKQRCMRLENNIAANKSLLAHGAKQGVERLFMIEEEYRQAMLKAELSWTRKLVDQINSGKIEGIEKWKDFYREHQADELSEKRHRMKERNDGRHIEPEPTRQRRSDHTSE